MRKFVVLLIIILTVMPFALFGQSYTSLWKQAKEAGDKDLPKTEYEVLQKIVAKATREKAYGQLMKAELQGALVMGTIAPDSLGPAVERIWEKGEAAQDVVLKTVYQTVVYRLAHINRSLQIEAVKPVLDEALCRQLARVKDKTYVPLVVEGADSRVFDHDLLSVVGYELEDYQTLHDYYRQAGNRQAACVTAAKAFAAEGLAADVSKIDSLLDVYGDIEEAGELAIARYNASPTMTVAQKIDFIHQALNRWGGWKRMSLLSDEETALTNPMFELSLSHSASQPMKPQTVTLEMLRNISRLTFNVYSVKADGDIDLNPNYADDYKKLRPLLTLLPQKVVERTYSGHQPYEKFKDTLTLEGLPVGVYMLELTTEPATSTVRRLYYVTDVYTLAEAQPGGQTRFAVVNATTGQPIAGAKLRIKQYTSYDKFTTKLVTVDGKGEYLYENKKQHRTEIFAYTDADKACPPMNSSNQYRYYDNDGTSQHTQVYTDRAIYRPGQTVHASALVYDVTDGYRQQVTKGKAVTFTLRDANWKEVKRITATTDDYGVCSADFTLPASALTGHFTLQANNHSHSIRVEEYKRPSFEVTFDEVKQHYEAGDTVRVQGTARSYAGVPVQGATVEYTVERRMAFWWWSYWRYYDMGVLGLDSDDDEVFSGEAVTDSEGHFTVEMPMTLPESEHPLFYNFVVTADVTDTAGETHSGTLSLPLGNRKTALSVDLDEQILAESKPTMTFHLRNAAGNDIDAQVRYRIDEGEWLTAQSNQHLSLITSHISLLSGRHTLEAVCEGDTLKRDFTVFSVDDKRPATETDEWFWQSAGRFPNDGSPVTVQAGASAPDLHVLYSIFAGEKLIESGAVDMSNALINRKLTYKEEYGNGLLLSFVWVKNGQSHSRTIQIQRPLPDKKLQIEWSTFRDRLTPGQQEEWTLTVKGPDGKPVQASLMATLYDKSLDQLQKHGWSLSPYAWLPMPDTRWTYHTWYQIWEKGARKWSRSSEPQLKLSRFDETLFYVRHRGFSVMGYGNARMMRSAAVMDLATAAEPEAAPIMKAKESVDELQEVVVAGYGIVEKATAADMERMAGNDAAAEPTVQLRENLNETAFFYPQLVADKQGVVALKFTLPESLTTWRFMGLAHTQDMCYGMLEGEAVAQKEVMIQPNMPRFIREGDEATISARIFNTGEKAVSGTATLRLVDPETDAVVFETSQPFSVDLGSTTAVKFNVQRSSTSEAAKPSATFNVQRSLLVCQVSASGKGFSDGEQHYLPVLPASERVTVTVPFTQNEPGTKTIDLAALIPADGTDAKLTFEYTGNPDWLMIQALPTVGQPIDENAISQAASFYANSLGQYLIDQMPKAKTVFELWKQEEAESNSQPSTLNSQLEKNQELKDILLGETPWVLDADRETEQKHRLADFFDANTMQGRLSASLDKLRTLQREDGSWSWWPDMPGSFYMTVAVSEMLVRLNTLAGKQSKTDDLLDRAFGFMGQEVVSMVDDMKQSEKKGRKVGFPNFKTLRWLYLCTLDGRKLPSRVQAANDYLLPLLKKDIKSQSIYEKALTAVILSKVDALRAKEYVRSLKEYTVYREEMGRYYDTPRAGYSWFDYRIPTQTMAIEALQRLTPDDRQTISEMQRWLLQSKRTQAWDTPINSVNAIYAFLNGSGKGKVITPHSSRFSVDGQPLDTPKATAALGYVKTVLPDAKAKSLTVDKTSEGTSWGAVYAQFNQPVKSIASTGSGITVTREILTDSQRSSTSEAAEPSATFNVQRSTFNVGDRVKVRLTIEADRDLDFVQVIDRRAACMEPVRQLSGYHSGSYCTPRDYSTNYYFDILSKGRHVIETEYYIDRPGTYETGTCTVQCAYAPEFRGTAPSQTLIIK